MPDEPATTVHEIGNRRLWSTVAALLVTLPVALAASLTQVAAVGLVLVPVAALIGSLLVPSVRSRNPVLAGAAWGSLVAVLTGPLFTIGYFAVAELQGGWYFPRLDETPDVYVTFFLLMAVALTLIMAIPLTALGIVWARLARTLERAAGFAAG